MSDLEPLSKPLLRGGRGAVPGRPTHELLPPRTTSLGGDTVVRRLLPNLGRRMVGAWCFVDHYGPDDIADEPGMWVPPHPHTGLQTVSWLHDGEVLHRDSLGSLQTVRPRELGLMTAGRAISHAEQSPREHAPLLHGAQLWVALPGPHRAVAPAFEHHPDLPVVSSRGGLRATVILGETDGVRSPGTTYSPLLGLDVALTEGADVRLPVEPDFEYAVLTMSGTTRVDGVPLDPGAMLYLGSGRRELPLSATSDAGLLLLGGEPFAEEIVMWWNFVGRTHQDIEEARTAWMSGDRFGVVEGFDGEPLPAPVLPATPLKARGRAR
ncbi:pirin [Wenjunlia vitaminophila]|uniref:Pirin n=1 Tax=Wenjunlia vitaminophila TaxID=76728 RepID=A0A0T6LZ53_WENVI|nr:pirin family protein [Wenjunlia vitaminophila]KRV51403.1 pirin [Wenjunlia vitaminophila]